MNHKHSTRDRSTPAARSMGLILAVVVALATGCSEPEKSLDVFEDVTRSSGLGDYVGMTYGATWGDFDGDGRADLYLTNHLNPARLYRNLGAGRFEDVTAAVFAHDDTLADKHGSAWADFDNDGRQDLVQLTGAVRGVGEEPKLLFHNRGDTLVNVAGRLGVSNLDGRTRMPLWVDLDHDGRLDLIHGADTRLDDKTPPFVYMQGERGFSAAQIPAFDSRTVPFCTLADLTGNNQPELLCRIVGKTRTAQIFDLSARPPRDLELLPATAFEDVAAADFDNDGQIDLFLVRKNPPGPIAIGRPSDKAFVADVWTTRSNADQPMGFSFRSQGKLKLSVASGNPNDVFSTERIYLGPHGTHPGGMTFELSPATPGIAGMAPNVPGEKAGVYIGFTAPDKWDVRITAAADVLAAGTLKDQEIQLRVTGTKPVTKLEVIGQTTAEEAPARLFMNRGGKLVEEGDERGVNKRLVAGMNVVAGDFDNDMDVDLFVLASGGIGQQENLLLLNDGKGYFSVVKTAGGAGGSLNGVGDSVTRVDFDGDGFLDLLIANGGSMGRSLGLPSDDGGYQLFRNRGNGNHWLQIDLEGARSNRDGVGAVVRVTTGGVSQIRQQDGGMHHRGQNHSRLHFGLAKHARIDKITVHWPSGLVQELLDVKADQILHVKEPGA